MLDRYIIIRPNNTWHNTNNSLQVTRQALHNLASSATPGSVSSRKIGREFSITSGQTADKSLWATEGVPARGRRLKIERERHPRISQPATPQMKHTWVVLDLARIIPHPRLSTTHRANTATHVEQTHTRDSVCTVNEEIYGCTGSKSSHASITREKKKSSSHGKNYSFHMCR